MSTPLYSIPNLFTSTGKRVSLGLCAHTSQQRYYCCGGCKLQENPLKNELFPSCGCVECNELVENRVWKGIAENAGLNASIAAMIPKYSYPAGWLHVNCMLFGGVNCDYLVKKCVGLLSSGSEEIYLTAKISGDESDHRKHHSKHVEDLDPVFEDVFAFGLLSIDLHEQLVINVHSINSVIDSVVGTVRFPISKLLAVKSKVGIFELYDNEKITEKTHGMLEMTLYFENFLTPSKSVLVLEATNRASKVLLHNTTLDLDWVDFVALEETHELVKTDPVSILVYVKCFGGNSKENLSVVVNTRMKIGDVKRCIQNLTGFNVKNIFYAGKNLSSESSLVESGIQKECTIQAYLQPSEDEKQGLFFHTNFVYADEFLANVSSKSKNEQIQKRLLYEQIISNTYAPLGDFELGSALIITVKSTKLPENWDLHIVCGKDAAKFSFDHQSVKDEKFIFFLNDAISSCFETEKLVSFSEFSFSSFDSLNSDGACFSNFRATFGADSASDNLKGSAKVSLQKSFITSPEMKRAVMRLSSIGRRVTPSDVSAVGPPFDVWFNSDFSICPKAPRDLLYGLISSNVINLQSLNALSYLKNLLPVPCDIPTPVLIITDISDAPEVEKAIFKAVDERSNFEVKRIFFVRNVFDRHAMAYCAFPSVKSSVLALLGLVAGGVTSVIFGTEWENINPMFIKAGFLFVSDKNLEGKQEAGETFLRMWVSLLSTLEMVISNSFVPSKDSIRIPLKEATVVELSTSSFQIVTNNPRKCITFKSNEIVVVDAWLGTLKGAKFHYVENDVEIAPKLINSGYTKQEEEATLYPVWMKRVNDYRMKSWCDLYKDSILHIKTSCQNCGNLVPLSEMYRPEPLSGSKMVSCRSCWAKRILRLCKYDQVETINSLMTVSDLLACFSKFEFVSLCESLFQSVLKCDRSYVKCPKCALVFNFVPPGEKRKFAESSVNIDKFKRYSVDFSSILPFTNDVSGYDDKPLNKEMQHEYFVSRCVCINSDCNSNWCRICAMTPFHTGMSCEFALEYGSAPKCRFCSSVVTSKNRVDSNIVAFKAVCDSEACTKLILEACPKFLKCSHFCFGHKDDLSCLPCLVEGCASLNSAGIAFTDTCSICYTDELACSPCLKLTCGHIFHKICLEQRLISRWSGARISFDYLKCPLCNEDIQHKLLNLESHRNLESEITKLSMQYLIEENLTNDPAIINPDGLYYKKPEKFAVNHFSFFRCFACQEPYFAGARECVASDQIFKPEDLLCSKCFKVESVIACKFHGGEWLQYKCRFCCSPATFHCWNKTHFCAACHVDAVWRQLVQNTTGINLRPLHQYIQCDGLRLKIEAVMKNDALSSEAKDKAISLLSSEPDSCPLKVRHPPNGLEFGIGCTMCQNKDEEERFKRENDKSREKDLATIKIKQEFLSKFPSIIEFNKFTSDFDENGLLFFLGTFGRSKPFQNVASLGFVKISSSSIDSSSNLESLGGREPKICFTKDEPSSWFMIDLVNISFALSGFTLRHFHENGLFSLVSWDVEGSNDGIYFYTLWSDTSKNLLYSFSADPFLSELENRLGVSCTFDISEELRKKPFRFIRIRQTGVNSLDQDVLSLSNWEFYGSLFTDPKIIKDSIVKEQEEKLERHKSALRKTSVKTFRFVSDFDRNGILFFLGCQYGMEDYKNPVERGLLNVVCSEIAADSAPVMAAAGRAAVRCLSTAKPNSFFTFDFLDCGVIPTHYSLRHYSSWDVEALRFWNFEGFNGKEWKILNRHVNDTFLNKRGATHTWKLPFISEVFTCFRIVQTGKNSNDNLYLALSGFEVYGRITPLELAEITRVNFDEERTSNIQQIIAKFGKPKLFLHSYPGDESGLLFWIGCNQGKASYSKNLVDSVVRVSSSPLVKDSMDASFAIGRSAVRMVTASNKDSFVRIDFDKYFIEPKFYSLRHYTSWDVECLRSWVFLGSFDGGNTWILLRQHVNDISLNQKEQWASWPVSAGGNKFNSFMIQMTGLNSNQHFYLAMSGFELYGDVYYEQLERRSSIIKDDIKEVEEEKSVEMKQKCLIDKNLSGRELDVDDTRQVVKHVGGALWMTALSEAVFCQGIVQFTVRFDVIPLMENIWKVCVGFVPASFDALRNQSWVSQQNGWCYIANGRKCFGGSADKDYAVSFSEMDLITCSLDFSTRLLSFFKNHKPLGIAFRNVHGDLRAAASLRAYGTVCRFIDFSVKPSVPLPICEPSRGLYFKWKRCDPDIEISGNGLTACCNSKDDLWNMCIGDLVVSSGEHYFEFKVEEDEPSSNPLRITIGLVPAFFFLNRSYVGGPMSGWSYSAAGSICHGDGAQPINYGIEYSWNDVIGMQVDFDSRSLEFFVNGVSQGIAFTNVKGSSSPAISLTGYKSKVSVFARALPKI